MPDFLTRWLLFPLGAVLGYAWARRRAVDDVHSDDPARPAAGVDAAAVPGAGDVDLRLALAEMSRHRGELDQAIAAHRKILDGDRLTDRQRDQTEYELAQDYLQAGLLDRAEVLLDGLCARGRRVNDSLTKLLQIHEQARDWPRAIDTARRLQATQGRAARTMIAHYHCELAEQARIQDDLSSAIASAERALDEDPDCVRASLLLGTLAEARSQPERALRVLRRVPDQDPRFIGMVLPALRRCCEGLRERQAYCEFIEETEQRFPRVGAIRIERARLAAERGEDGASRLALSLPEAPGWQGFLAWLELQRDLPAEQSRALHAAMVHLASKRQAYRCAYCGLTPAALFWQCPRCRHWGSVGPGED